MPEKPRVQTAARTIAIATEVALAGPEGISAKDLSDRLNLPRQVVYHLVHTLVSIGFLRKARATNYVLGLGAAPIARSFGVQLRSGDMLSRYAAAAAKETGETAYVVGWMYNEIVVGASIRGSSSITATEIPEGTTGDAHARASGKLLLSSVPRETVEHYLRGNPLAKRTVNTLVDTDSFFRELDVTRERGFGIDAEEYEIGLSCIAVPLGGVSSMLALGISAPTARLKERMDHYLDILRRIASQNIDI